jgi:hypothetical protein
VEAQPIEVIISLKAYGKGTRDVELLNTILKKVSTLTGTYTTTKDITYICEVQTSLASYKDETSFDYIKRNQD